MHNNILRSLSCDSVIAFLMDYCSVFARFGGDTLSWVLMIVVFCWCLGIWVWDDCDCRF